MIKVKESAAPRKPKAAVRKPVARRVTIEAKKRRPVTHVVSGLVAIPIEDCPNCRGTGKRPRSMTAAERQRLRRARLKGGK